MHNNIQQELTALVIQALKAGALDKLPHEEVILDLPTDRRFGDFTTNIALKLSKVLKNPPRNIAAVILELIQGEIPKANLGGLIKQVKIEGPVL